MIVNNEVGMPRNEAIASGAPMHFRKNISMRSVHQQNLDNDLPIKNFFLLYNSLAYGNC